MTESHTRDSPVLRVWAHVLGSQRSRNIAVFGHRFCGPCFAVLAGPRENARTQGPLVGPLLQSRKSPLRVSSSRYLLAPRSSSFHRGGSNKSTGFYSCLSDILYSAGPGVSPRASLSSSFAPSLPFSSRAYGRARARAPYVINAGNSMYAQSTRSGGLQVRPHVRGLTYWTVYTLRLFKHRAVCTKTY